MSSGADKIAKSLLDLQPTAIVEMFQLFFNTVDKETSYIAFHGGSVFSEGIWWQGIQYLPLPVETEGFEVNANGRMARPTIRISNKNYFITDLLNNNQDLQFAKVIRKRTFIKYLDDKNFDGGNPWNDADASAEISNDTFVISQKTAENKVYVEFELSSPLDLENFEINNRLMLSRYCPWYYRGNGCNYQGPPLEMEDGTTPLVMNSGSIAAWKTVSQQNIWKTGNAYSSGDPVFLENKKIIVNPRTSSDVSGYAKIWYIARKDHVSNYTNQPDSNETFWARDGCSKLMKSCKKRFQVGDFQALGSSNISITNNYIDLSYKSGYKNLNTNNIAARATGVSVSSEYSSSAFNRYNTTDLSTGLNVKNSDEDNSWRISGNWNSSSNPAWIRFYWDAPKMVERVDIYDRPQEDINFNNAYLKFYNGSSLVKSGMLTGIYSNGARTISGFSPIAITSLEISGSGCSTNKPVGLGEVCIYESSGLGFYDSDFTNSGIHMSNSWHIGSWINFPNGPANTLERLNIFHNVTPINAYSGINCYLFSGKMYLNFAVVSVSGSSPSYEVKNKTISIPWSANTLQPLHVICSGGKTSGLMPTSIPSDGFISIGGKDQSTFSTYSLANADISKNFSGEFFLFKNPSYQNGIGTFKIGVNDWQFSNNAYAFTDILGAYHGMKITSNLQMGTTAIWTGLSSINSRQIFFNRQNSDEWNVGNEGLSPRIYSEIPSASTNLTKDLYSWWDMDLSNTSPYRITSSNSPIKYLNLSGQYTGSIETSTTNIYNNASIGIGQTTVKALPFGGFPGTEKYGR